MCIKYSLLILIFIEISCKSVSQGSRYLKECFSDVCVENSSVSLARDTVRVLENMSKNIENISSEYSYRVLANEVDTFKTLNYLSILPDAINDTIEQMKLTSVFIDTMGAYKFKYEAVPYFLNTLFKDDEVVEHFLSYSDQWIYITRNNKDAKRKLYMSKKDDKEAIHVELPENPSTPNFFLFDMVEDSNPEIFVFYKVHFMGRDLIETHAYKISGGNTERKPF